MLTLSRKLRLAILLLLLVSTVGCDQTTKFLAHSRLGDLGSVPLPGGFGELRLAKNPGSFLSLGDSLPLAVRRAFFTIGVTAGLLALFGYLVSRAGLNRLTFLGLALILAGGIGNLIDRFTQDGLVTDFIFLQLGPLHTGVFNVADVWIMAGIALVAAGIRQVPPIRQTSGRSHE